MFHAKAHFYKNVDGREEEIEKTFNNEKEFDTFVDRNPDLKKLRGLKAPPIGWSPLSSMKGFFDEVEYIDRINFPNKTPEEIPLHLDHSGKQLEK